MDGCINNKMTHETTEQLAKNVKQTEIGSPNSVEFSSIVAIFNLSSSSKDYSRTVWEGLHASVLTSTNGAYLSQLIASSQRNAKFLPGSF